MPIVLTVALALQLFSPPAQTAAAEPPPTEKKETGDQQSSPALMYGMS